ncbi:MAG: hypothetical protein IPI48_04285 [bacterium]|nr:hypothetical protein [bacterium]
MAPPARSDDAINDHWSHAFSRPGVDGDVRRVVIDANDNVYVGGSFARAGDMAASNVAMWDGAQWTALGAGVDGDVHEMVMGRHGNLYAHGNFTHAGGKPVPGLAVWDGAAWSALGAGVDCHMVALCVDGNGDLYAGGTFLDADGDGFSGIAKWDGTSWSWPCPGAPYPAGRLAVDDSGNVYASYYYFPEQSTLWYGGIVKWDGSTWTTIVNQQFLALYSLIIGEDSNLYVGGSFTTVGGVAAANVATWDGTAWSPLGAGLLSWWMP